VRPALAGGLYDWFRQVLCVFQWLLHFGDALNYRIILGCFPELMDMTLARFAFRFRMKRSEEKPEDTMKKLLLGVVGFAALSIAAPASAADLATYTKAPLPVTAAIYDWRGFYIGGNGGYGWSESCWNITPVGGAVIPDGCRNQSGGLVGGQIGYRWEGSSWVFGLEAQGDWANLSSSHVSLFNPTFTDSSKIQGLGLFTAQLGYAWNAALVYAKGGLALTSNRFDVNTTLGGVGLASVSSTRWGEAVGVGFEYGFAPNWSAGIEYDHLFMGDANNSFSVGALGASALNRINQDVNMVTARVNYRFGGPFY
jgi:outer membrane immunogenic protein